jgi:hypothetical protein
MESQEKYYRIMVLALDEKVNIVNLTDGAEEEVLSILEQQFIHLQPLERLRGYFRQWIKKWNFATMILRCLECDITILDHIQVYSIKRLLKSILPLVSYFSLRQMSMGSTINIV